MDIIVIDDDKFIGKVFSKILAPLGYEFAIYDCPKEGFDAVVKHRPHCVILDYLMPDLKGDELIVKSSQELLFKDSNFILVTGEKLDEMDKMKLMTLGFQYIFSKGQIRSKDFLDIITELVEDKKSNSNQAS